MMQGQMTSGTQRLLNSELLWVRHRPHTEHPRSTRTATTDPPALPALPLRAQPHAGLLLWAFLHYLG